MVSEICTIMIGMIFGKNVQQQDTEFAIPRQPRRQHEACLAPHVGFGAGDTRIEREINDGGGDDDVGDGVAERGDDAHRQHEQRERHDSVGNAGDDAVGPAAEIARRDSSEPAHGKHQYD